MKNVEVMSFMAVCVALGLPLRKVKDLVKGGDLTEIHSRIWKIPAITRESFLDYIKSKEIRKEETFSQEEVRKLLKMRSGRNVEGLGTRMLIDRIGVGMYSKSSVYKYMRMKKIGKKND